MEKTYIATIYEAAKKTADKDEFVSEWCLSTVVLNPEDIDEDVTKNVKWLSDLWTVAHSDFKQLRKLIGITQREMSEVYCIPLRTIESWESKSDSHREMPEYLKLMIARLSGLVIIP